MVTGMFVVDVVAGTSVVVLAIVTMFVALLAILVTAQIVVSELLLGTDGNSKNRLLLVVVNNSL